MGHQDAALPLQSPPPLPTATAAPTPTPTPIIPFLPLLRISIIIRSSARSLIIRNIRIIQRRFDAAIRQRVELGVRERGGAVLEVVGTNSATRDDGTAAGADLTLPSERAENTGSPGARTSWFGL